MTTYNVNDLADELLRAEWHISQEPCGATRAALIAKVAAIVRTAPVRFDDVEDAIAAFRRRVDEYRKGLIRPDPTIINGAVSDE